MQGLDVFNFAKLTESAPFCAGAVVFWDGDLVVTLNADGLPPNLQDGRALRVGGVGGGQQLGETIVDCALRESREELSVPVTLISSPITFYEDLDQHDVQRVSCTDDVKPFLVQRVTNPSPSRPYASGLPTGPYLYFNLFFAVLSQGNAHAGDDVAALLRLPPTAWNMLTAPPALDLFPLDEILGAGARIEASENFVPPRHLWVPGQESFRSVAKCLQANPSLRDLVISSSQAIS